MKVGTKIMFGVAVTTIAATLASVVTVYVLANRNRIAELHEKMSAIIAQSDDMAGNMDAMYRAQSFDQAGLLKRAREQLGSRSLHEAYAETDFYRTVPIVASWQSAAAAAQRAGFDFLVGAPNDHQVRNPKHRLGPDYEPIYAAFDAGQTEVFTRDKESGYLLLARPVKFRESCLSCHGNPANSPTKDGKDILGFPMENQTIGHVAGAFILKAPITADARVLATAGSMAIVGLFMLGGAVGGFYFFNRRVIVAPLVTAIDELDTVSAQTSSAASEVSASGHALADGANQQAAALEETSATLEEISSMTKRNSEHATNAKDLSAQTRTAAELGTTRMGEMRQAVDQIKASSDNIAKIVKSIDEIAFQTNILALNAAVEAARAGEAGAGFAVVAEEVRALAQRSAQAARETAERIEDSIRKSEQGVQLSTTVAESFEEIVSKARKMDELVAEIATASNEQAQGIGQVTAAITQMDRVTQSNAASAQESASAAEELNQQAQIVRESIVTLHVMVSGEANSSSAPAHRPSGPSPQAEAPVAHANVRH